MSRMLQALRQLESKADSFESPRDSLVAEEDVDSEIAAGQPASAPPAALPTVTSSDELSPPPSDQQDDPPRELSPLEMLEAAVAQFDDPTLLPGIAEHPDGEWAAPVYITEQMPQSPQLGAASRTDSESAPAPIAIEQQVERNSGDAELPEAIEPQPAWQETIAFSPSATAPTAQKEPRRSAEPIEEHEPAVEPVNRRAASPKVTLRPIPSPLADQMRELAEAVASEFPAREAAAILVLGVDAGDHASLVARGLSLFLAKRGEVLLLDANLANRTLTAEVGLGGHPGLAEILTHSCHNDDPIMHSAAPNLWIMPAGQGIVLRPANLNEFIPSLISELRFGRRWVVVHAGAAEAALTKALARSCDGVYLTVRLGTTIPEEAAEVARSLQASGAQVRGCIATNAPALRTKKSPKSRKRA